MLRFTEEQNMVRDALSRHLANRIVPRVEAERHDEQFPVERLREVLSELGQFGVGQARVSVSAGGMGLDNVTAGLIHETTAQQLHEVASPALINESVGMLLDRIGTPQINQRYLAPLLEGKLIAASANTESYGGSNIAAIQTRARACAGGYRISGRKLWITNGHFADFVLVLARSEDSGKPDFYLVDRHEHGFDARPQKVAGHTTVAELAFDEVEVPEGNRLTSGKDGLKNIFGAFHITRAFVALSACGIARAAFDMALAFAADRSPFGKPIAGAQLVQAQLADCEVELEAARLLAYQALQLADAGEPFDHAASLAKLYASEMVQRVTARACQIHGALGLSDEMPVARLKAAAQIFPIVEGASEVQRLIIGRTLTGINGF